VFLNSWPRPLAAGGKGKWGKGAQEQINCQRAGMQRKPFGFTRFFHIASFGSGSIRLLKLVMFPTMLSHEEK